MITVLCAGGIEMRSGGFEVGWVALRKLVNVQGMLAGREVFDIDLDLDAVGASESVAVPTFCPWAFLISMVNGLVAGAADATAAPAARTSRDTKLVTVFIFPHF